jgi:DNA-binding MarR family transcriptional regulator
MEPITAPPNPFVAETGSLVIPSFEQLFFLPGDWLIYLLSSRAHPIAEMLGLGPADYGGTLAGFIAWTCWIVLAIVAIATTSAVRRFDRVLTGRIIDACLEVRRRWRMALVFADYRRKLRAQRKEPTIDVAEEPGLSREELRVLELHAKLSPGFALSTRDVAEELNTRGHEIRAALERLQKLNLLNATVGGYDGETAYTLSPAGRTLLQIRHARPRIA